MGVKYKEYKNFGFLIERTIKRIRQEFQRRLSEMDVAITVDQWVILDRLNNGDGLSQRELAQATYKDAPTVTRIIDLLCQKELTERRASENDRRRFQIYLTEEGKSTIRKVMPMVSEFRQQGWEGLNEEDYAHLIHLMDSIYHNFSRE